jgi:nucleotide-binding universal stress UspA family protein
MSVERGERAGMYKDILLAVDLNEESSWNRALPTAVEYARAFGSTLHVVTVAPDFATPFVGQFFPEGYAKEVADKLLETLHAFVKSHVPADVPVQHIVSEGTVYQEILRVAAQIGADLIVMASHRPELKDYLLGPNAARVVRHAECSVLVVRG